MLLRLHLVPSIQVLPSTEEAAAPTSIQDIAGVLDLKGLASRVGQSAEALGPALTAAHPSLLQACHQTLLSNLGQRA